VARKLANDKCNGTLVILEWKSAPFLANADRYGGKFQILHYRFLKNTKLFAGVEETMEWFNMIFLRIYFCFNAKYGVQVSIKKDGVEPESYLCAHT
jgi:hypothetical protein